MGEFMPHSAWVSYLKSMTKKSINENFGTFSARVTRRWLWDRMMARTTRRPWAIRKIGSADRLIINGSIASTIKYTIMNLVIYL